MNPEPASAAVEAFNAVLRLSGADLGALDHAAWRLSGLWRRSPASVVSGLGLMITYQLRGERGKAVETADELWGRRAGMMASERAIFATVLASMGSYGRACDVVAAGVGDDETARSAIRGIVVGAWDSDVPGFSLTMESPGFAALLVEMERIGLAAHMRDRQAVVNEIIVPHQLNAATSAETDGGDKVILTRIVYTDLDVKENLELALRVSDAEQAFYQERGIDPDAACYLVTEVLLPARGQLPVTEHLQAEVA